MSLSELSPKEVFDYFQKLAAIPHGSGNTDRIAEFCMEFAKEHGLRARKDEANNVVIFADGSPGYEKSEPVILQGHLDMVCEKDEDCRLDMEQDGLEVCTDGVKVWAEGTTLGGDDGIAIAYILAILASDTIPHPPIEALLTSDEEIGMLGANALDVRDLTAKRLINIDSEEEGVLYVSCAGGVSALCDIPFCMEQTNQAAECAYRITVSGLLGGHSGTEIHRNRGNAIKLLGAALASMSRTCTLSLVHVSGGGKENAIPKTAEATVCVPANQAHTLEQGITEFLKLINQELSAAEPGLLITATPVDMPKQCMNQESTRRVIFALQQFPDGMQKMSSEIEGLVQTSLNLGILFMEDDHVVFQCLIRSNTAGGKQLIMEKVTAFTGYLGGTVTMQSDYPAWEYRAESRLREIMIHTYEEVYQKAPHVTAIHAGLECGILAGKMPDVDMISFGPTLENVHTPRESMDVASVKRSWYYLLKVLENLQ
ncbi:MAG: aminoacyl-histidine dipeptidase [Clostridium sp.]|nr:aminoacyl-histidine dipeptidase [Clostridium sp.]MCM1397973.1 aminoacyl-histidine dipeptidase [Clostridium sp.]MCM1459391.1 aminoacyl-histidine dipeptidase [Bacteroides sp.]